MSQSHRLRPIKRAYFERPDFTEGELYTLYDIVADRMVGEGEDIPNDRVKELWDRLSKLTTEQGRGLLIMEKLR